jgi:hypothetical protein
MTAFAPETFARQASAATELVRAHLAAAAAGERLVWPGESPDAVLDAWPDPTVAPPISLDHLLEDFISASTAQHHPGFIGQQLSSPPPLVGPLALVATVLNNSAATSKARRSRSRWNGGWLPG